MNAYDEIIRNKKWEFKAGAGITANQTAWQRNVFIGRLENKVCAVDAAIGVKKWDIQLPE